MRRALATLSLTIAALTFILRFNPQSVATFDAGTDPSATAPNTSDPAASSPGQSTSTEAATTIAATTSTVAPTTSTIAPTTTVQDRVIDGAVVRTQWGAVQVEVTLSGDTITDVTALRYPDHTSLSLRINDFVLPMYREAALEAQSARFMGVSGATVTWWGYVHSMQSALDSIGA